MMEIAFSHPQEYTRIWQKKQPHIVCMTAMYSSYSIRQIGICAYSLVATSMATKRILSLKSVGMLPKMRLSQSESAKQSAAYKN